MAHSISDEELKKLFEKPAQELCELMSEIFMIIHDASSEDESRFHERLAFVQKQTKAVKYSSFFKDDMLRLRKLAVLHKEEELPDIARIELPKILVTAKQEICGFCEDAPAVVYCPECDLMLCDENGCNQENHTNETNHNRQTLMKQETALAERAKYLENIVREKADKAEELQQALHDTKKQVQGVAEEKTELINTLAHQIIQTKEQAQKQEEELLEDLSRKNAALERTLEVTLVEGVLMKQSRMKLWNKRICKLTNQRFCWRKDSSGKPFFESVELKDLEISQTSALGFSLLPPSGGKLMFKGCRGVDDLHNWVNQLNEATKAETENPRYSQQNQAKGTNSEENE
eukprot:CAMPEP_0175134020 /NCGR_PEP_ID=MMETSP0087-20121206/7958_1 /TAXON_ID=136419 /ORGANISM="Unknown Unknown, Strain D1" /LENGTH=345 /DNA_ID=CAMNT_0016416559 /DNA_START=1 /DNA_END=1038 /DNA_ORIENTATION=-